MGFFIAMFVCNLLMPLIMLIGGYCMYKNPPKEINGLVGYSILRGDFMNEKIEIKEERISSKG